MSDSIRQGEMPNLGNRDEEKMKDLIDRYVTDKLTREEREEFEALMQRDPDINREVQLLQRVACQLGERKEKMEAIRKWEKENPANFSVKNPDCSGWIFRSKKIRWGLSIAAACVVVVTAGVMLFPTSQPETVNPVMIENNEAIRGGGDLTMINALIQEGKYPEALRELDEMEKSIMREIAGDPDLSQEEKEYRRIVGEDQLREIQKLREEIGNKEKK